MSDEQDQQNQGQELEKLKRKTQMIRNTNASIVHEIETLGGNIEVTVARVEHMFNYLVEIGVMTEFQLWSEIFSWEQGLKSQLVPIVGRLRTNPRPGHKLN